jgi:ribonuclease HII
VNVAAVSGRGNRPPRARRPRIAPVDDDALMLWPAAEGTVGVASGEQPQPSAPVGEDEAMEGEKR